MPTITRLSVTAQLNKARPSNGQQETAEPLHRKAGLLWKLFRFCRRAPGRVWLATASTAMIHRMTCPIDCLLACRLERSIPPSTVVLCRVVYSTRVRTV